MDNSTAVSIAGRTEASLEASGDVDSVDSSVIDVESHWDVLPPGIKGLFLNCDKMETKELACSGKNEGMAQVFNFATHSCSLFANASDTKEYHWNFWQTITSSYILAAEFFLQGREHAAIFMIFYAAMVEECLAQGTPLVNDWLWNRPSTTSEDEKNVYKRITFSVKDLFSKFATLYRAFVNTRTRIAMASFLNDMLKIRPNAPDQEHHDVNILKRQEESIIMFKEQLEGFLGDEKEDAVVHSFDTHGAEPRKLMKIFLVGRSLDSKQEIEVYGGTTLKWVMHASLAMCNGKFAVLGGFERINPKKIRCPFLRIINGVKDFPPNLNGPAHYLLTSGDKTLDELGFKDDDIFRLCFTSHIRDDLVFVSGKWYPRKSLASNYDDDEDRRKKKKSKGKANSRRKKSTRSNQSYLPYHKTSVDSLREAHSKAMEPVLHELRPQLKVIRDKLAALSLQKSLPRSGRLHNIAKRENENVSNASENASKEDSYCGKAGKSVYPVLVGEVTHLYKTLKLSLRKSKPFQRVTTLDLHGCSMDKALEMLHKGLHEWVEEAMKGEHPFVIPVNIICGGGNQILSEVVAQFIRDNPQVANRPRGTV